MIFCARGCLLPGRHAPGCNDCMCACHSAFAGACDVGGGCWARHEGCTGCAVSQAVEGVLCARCSRRLRDLLGEREAPEGPHGFAWIYDWLSQNLDPVTNPRSDGRGGSPDPPVPIRLEVLDVQFQINETLQGWMAATIDVAAHANLRGPRVLSAGAVTRWLLAQIRTVEAAPFAGDVVDELDEMCGEAHRCAPWRPQNRALPGVPCPWCHSPALRIRGGEADVTCGHCGAWIEHDRYMMWARYLEESLHAGKRAKT